jgi:hypothetical protein
MNAMNKSYKYLHINKKKNTSEEDISKKGKYGVLFSLRVDLVLAPLPPLLR